MNLRAALVLLLALAGCGNLQATQVAPFTPRPAERVDAVGYGDIKAFWIGHATVLLRIGDKWILTDPNFSGRVGLLAKRFVAPGVDLSALPPVDWVLVSHAHPDHLDTKSLLQIAPSASLAVPPGVVQHLPARAFARVAALDFWESVEADGVRITAVPARHRDDRFFIDNLWATKAHTGFVIEYQGRTVFFAGDTAYDPAIFRAIGERFQVDLALIPVGPAGQPAAARLFTKPVHVNPEEAMRIFDDVHARFMIPIHHGTFWNAGASERAEVARAIHGHHAEERVFFLRAGASVDL